MHLKYKIVMIVIMCLLLCACGTDSNGNSSSSHNGRPDVKTLNQGDGYVLKPNVKNINEHIDYKGRDLKKIYFAGGCFWGVEAYMNRIYGVSNAISGYANGTGENPSYQDVIKGDQHFAETVEVTYDPERVSLETLMDRLFQVIDPTTKNQQGNDVGVQYRTGIYYINDTEKQPIEEAIQKEQKLYDNSIVTEVKPLKNFYKAEEFHQDYLEKNPNGYCHINLNTANEFEINPIDIDKEIVEKLSK